MNWPRYATSGMLSRRALHPKNDKLYQLPHDNQDWAAAFPMASPSGRPTLIANMRRCARAIQYLVDKKFGPPYNVCEFSPARVCGKEEKMRKTLRLPVWHWSAVLRSVPFIAFLLVLSSVLSGQSRDGNGVWIVIALWLASVAAWWVRWPKSDNG